MTDRSIITDFQHGLNSWAPANATGVLTTVPARYFMKGEPGNSYLSDWKHDFGILIDGQCVSSRVAGRF